MNPNWIENSKELDRVRYTRAMAENLPMLRTKLGMTQTQLAELIGVSRQTIYAMEKGSRDMSWGNFLSLLFLFRQNESTDVLLPILGIYTAELAALFQLTNTNNLGL